ncbi:hypothetical protein HH214_01180 [Mucilaginibacter robiniae]|uniref:Uncharacterized protein n=1 Tax=Mucilaginibacter robiniae TaxID=2728022 RepID=A0A7L5DZ76_9SPHI|nr:hypothetical protein [Mucilaginibacter robiniae]QJD94584.1 hypothetical protein HH214_01180 [Mucilaginibacter robiniae]
MNNINKNAVDKLSNQFDNELKKLLLGELKSFKAQKQVNADKSQSLSSTTLAAA